MLLLAQAMAVDHYADPADFAVVLAQAGPGDTIFLEPGIYAHPGVVSFDVSIVGTGSQPSEVVLREPGSGSTVVRIQGGAEVTYENVRFDGEGTYRGISLGTAELTLRDVEVIDGSSTGMGANVWVQTAGVLRCERCLLRGGSAVSDGGNLAVEGTAFVMDSRVEEGEATRGGGAYVAVSGSLDLTDTVFLQNHAAFEGGAVHAIHDTTVVRGRFCENDADGDGGAVAVDGGIFDARNVMFLMNNSEDEGGAIAANGGNLELAWLTLWGNTASVGGGAIAARSATQVDLDRSIVAGNVSPGFALERDGGPPNAQNVADSLYAGNTLDDTNWPENDTFVADPSLSPYVACGPTEAWPQPGSAAVDVLSNGADLDGSPADLGATGGPDAPANAWADDDQDGSPAWEDCDPADGSAHPGALELCGAVDHDCDGSIGQIDPDAVDQQPTFDDEDADGWGGAPLGVTCGGPGQVFTGDDCDDQQGTIHPTAAETPGNGIDEDCDGMDALGDDTGIDTGSPSDTADTPDTDLPVDTDPADTDLPVDTDPADTDGHGDTDDTDTRSDTDAPSETDLPSVPPPRGTRYGLGCASSPGLGSWAAALLGLALLRRRERVRPARTDCRR